MWTGRRTAGFWILLCATSWAQTQPRLPDAELKTTRGQPVRLSSLTGKPLVLIYEKRETREQNRAFKDRLSELGKSRGSTPNVRVLPVANLESYDFFPVRHFAQRYVVALEKSLQVQMLIDWTDALEKAPWNLPADKSSVLLVSAEGHIVFQRSGPLSEQEQEEFFTHLHALEETP